MPTAVDDAGASILADEKAQTAWEDIFGFSPGSFDNACLRISFYYTTLWQLRHMQTLRQA